MSKSSRSIGSFHTTYITFKNVEKFPEFFSKDKILTRKILNLWEYCICWNVILKIISIIPQTCVEDAKVNCSCTSGKYTRRFSFLPIWYPPSTGPESPDSWQPSALETCVFQRRFSSTLLVGCFFFACVFVLWVSCFFFVAGVNFLHDRRTWARVTHVLADKHKREERIVCFMKTNDCRLC